MSFCRNVECKKVITKRVKVVLHIFQHTKRNKSDSKFLDTVNMQRWKDVTFICFKNASVRNKSTKWEKFFVQNQNFNNNEKKVIIPSLY